MTAKENKFIPSIFSYCDRWCEHCSFTGRCKLFSMEEKREKENKGNGSSFIEELQKTFAETTNLIKEYAGEFDKDLSNIEEIAAKELPENQLSFLSTKYYEDAAVYLKELMNEIEEHSAVSSVIPRNTDMVKLHQIVECYEVIQWYHTLAPVKITRAISSTRTDTEEEDLKYLREDADGSAFIALKAILKTLAALEVVLGWTRSLKDETLNLIIDAGRIKHLIEKDFPGALNYVWPPIAREAVK